MISQAEIIIGAEIENAHAFAFMDDINLRPLGRGDLALDLFQAFLAQVVERVVNPAVKRIAHLGLFLSSLSVSIGRTICGAQGRAMSRSVARCVIERISHEQKCRRI